MDLKRKYWIFGIVCALALPVVLFTVSCFLYGKLPLEAQVVLGKNLRDNLPLLLTIFILTLMGLLILLNEIFHNFILPLEKLKDELRLIVAVKPSHRIAYSGGRDLRELADTINRVAELMQALHKRYPETHQSADAKIHEEKKILSGLLADIPGGVIAGNAEGRIFFYSQSAADLWETLQGASPNIPSGPTVGLDRSISSILSGQIGFTDKPDEVPASPFARFPATFEFNGVRGHFLKVESRDENRGYYLVFLQRATMTPGKEMNITETGRKSTSASVRKIRPGFAYYDFSILKKRRGADYHVRDVNLSELNYTVYDLETTGLNPSGGDRIISIGAVRVVNGRILFEETFYQMVNPGSSIPEESTRVHGITNDMLQGQPGIQEVFPAFCRYIEDSVLVSHCAEFDWQFLSIQARDAGIKIENPILDTFYLSLLIQQSQRDHSLESIANRLGTRIYDRHIAYGDAWTAAEILLKLIAALAAKGIYTIRQIEEQK